MEKFDVASFILRGFRGVFIDPWFITTLAECYICMFVARFFGKTIIGMSFVLVGLVGLAMCRPPGSPGGVHVSCLVNMLPHYAVGAIVFRAMNLRVWKKHVLCVLFFIMFLIFVVLEGDVKENGMSFYTSDVSFQSLMSMRGWALFVLRPVVGLIGSLGIMALVDLAILHFPRVCVLSKFGTLTLGIYLIHIHLLGYIGKVPWLVNTRCSSALTAITLFGLVSFITWILKEKVGRFAGWVWGKG